VTILDPLYKYYVQQCPLSEVYFIYTLFWVLAPLPYSGNCYYTDNFVFISCVSGDIWGFRLSILNMKLVHKPLDYWSITLVCNLKYHQIQSQ